MKQFNMSMDAVLWQYSWANLVMLMAAFSGETKEKKEEIKGIDPMDFFKEFNTEINER
jgi:hypothetical protein